MLKTWICKGPNKSVETDLSPPSSLLVRCRAQRSGKLLWHRLNHWKYCVFKQRVSRDERYEIQREMCVSTHIFLYLLCLITIAVVPNEDYKVHLQGFRKGIIIRVYVDFSGTFADHMLKCDLSESCSYFSFNYKHLEC